MALELRRTSDELKNGREVPVVFVQSNNPDKKMAGNETFQAKNILKKAKARWNGMNKRWEWKVIDPQYTGMVIELATNAVDEANKFIKAKAEEISKFVKKLQDIEEGTSEVHGVPRSDVNDVLDSIKDFIMDLQNEVDETIFDEKIQAYFQFAASMRGYSAQNTFLIMIQNPTATDVRSKTNWELVGRQPKQGAKPILLLRPNVRPKSQKQKQADEVLFRQKRKYKPNQPLSPADKVKLAQIQNNGIPVGGFAGYGAYDIKQVEAIPDSDKFVDNPTVKWSNDEADENAETLLNATVKAIKSNGISLEFQDASTLGGAKGYSAGGKIVLSKDNVGKGAFSTAVHEFAHEILHQNFLKTRAKDSKSKRDEEFLDLYVGKFGEKQIVELQAEATAYVVLRAFGYRLQEAVNYIVLFRNDRENIEANIDIIKRTANKIIREIDAQLNYDLNESAIAKELSTDQIANILGIEDLRQGGLEEEIYEEDEIDLYEDVRMKIRMHLSESVLKENASYTKWASTAEPIESMPVNRTTQRDIYKLPNGMIAVDNTIVPHNFKTPSHSIAWLDLIVPATPETEALVAQYGGTINEDIYTEDGFGHPYFESEADALKMAFEFAMQEGDRLKAELS